MPTSGSSSDRSAHPNRLATDRASLEVLLLVALPNVEEVACEEHVREMDAAEALWYRLTEHRQLQENEGEPQAAKETFERLERAGIAYTACLDICIEDNFHRLCRAGRTEEADELRSVLPLTASSSSTSMVSCGSSGSSAARSRPRMRGPRQS